jgi:hypothetical protein
MSDIPTQIRARLDAIAAERLRLDDEERRLRKALEALEPTAETSETPGLDEKIQRCIVPMTPGLPTYPMPYPAPHYPFQSFGHPAFYASGASVDAAREAREERLSRPG